MTKLIYANWKMALSEKESVELAEKVAAMDIPAGIEVAVFPTFTAIEEVGKVLSKAMGHGPRAAVQLGGQDCYWEDKGAYTGEVSASQLKELGCDFVIIGHSERRKLGETDEMVNRKLAAALAVGLIPVLCVGETKEERQNGHWASVLDRQVAGALKGIELMGTKKIVVAYEPVWAIGTGAACEPEMAADAHRLVMNAVVEIFGHDRAKKHFQVIYGGSVSADNIASYLRQEPIGGALVGGASQKFSAFSALIDAAK